MRPLDLRLAPAQDQDQDQDQNLVLALVLVLVLGLVAMVVAEGLLRPRRGRSAPKQLVPQLPPVSHRPALEDCCQMGLDLTNSLIRCRLPTLDDIQKEARANSLSWMKEDDDFIVGGAGLTMYTFSILDRVILPLAGLLTYLWRMIGMEALERCRHEKRS